MPNASFCGLYLRRFFLDSLDFSKILANFATWINEDENYAAELQLLAINVYRLPRITVFVFVNHSSRLIAP